MVNLMSFIFKQPDIIFIFVNEISVERFENITIWRPVNFAFLKIDNYYEFSIIELVIRVRN